MEEVSSTIKFCCGQEFTMKQKEDEFQKRVITIARSWIDTPYMHQASLKGQGCDCVGMVRGVYRELYGLEKEPEAMPPYQPDWYEVDQKDPLLAFGRKYLKEVPFGEMIPGDVLVFRMKPHVSAKHCGIITDTDMMVHAYSQQKVFEVSLGSHWLKKVAAVLRFPYPEE